jgi:hypothetical protein
MIVISADGSRLADNDMGIALMLKGISGHGFKYESPAIRMKVYFFKGN